MTWTDYTKALLALTMWREARGEGSEGMQAVGCVVRNRAKQGDWGHVMTAKWQFSSLTASADPMLIQWPKGDDPTFQTAMKLADGIMDNSLPDTTGGATHYFNPNVVLPSWAATMTHTVDIKHHTFFK